MSTATAFLFDLIGHQLGVFNLACPECGPRRQSSLNRRRKVLRIWHTKAGFLSFHCARCQWQGYARCDGKQAASTFSPTTTVSSAKRPDDGQRFARAMEIWNTSIAPTGTLVDRYLASRNLTLDHDILAADGLRFHEACPFGRERHPAMIALLRNAVTNEPKAILRTALASDGCDKAVMADGGSPKRMLGHAAGCAVKLVDDADVTLGLGIAEGLENALTAICAGWRPVWACGSAGAVERFPFLRGVESLTIFADADASGRGYDAAKECARRWQKAGKEATIIMPSRGDWNDVVRSVAA